MRTIEGMDGHVQQSQTTNEEPRADSGIVDRHNQGDEHGRRDAHQVEKDSPDSDTVELKLKLLGEARYVQLKRDDLSVGSIARKFDELFTLTASAERYVFQWNDEDGDWVTLDDTPVTRKHFLRTLNNPPFGILTIRGRCIHLQEDRERTALMGALTLTDQLSSIAAHGSRGCMRALLDGYTQVMNGFSRLNHLVVRMHSVRNILVMTKPGDATVARITRRMAAWLVSTFPSTTVLVDQWLRESPEFDYEGINRDVGNNGGDRVKFWRASAEDAKFCHNCEGDGFDLMVTLGGDGTVLHAAWLFQGPSPPIISFHMGSLGFLTVFDIRTFRESLSNIIKGGGIRLNVRMRLACSVYRCAQLSESKGTRQQVDHPLGGDGCAPEDRLDEVHPPVEVVDCAECLENFDEEGMSRKEPESVFHVLNELVVDRGVNPSMLQLELFVDGVHLTTILADGLVVATSTGSTAYSLAAGGSLVHPEKNTMLVTPICPHTLTCRPFQLPGTRNLRICVPRNSRTPGWASFDGRFRQELSYGESIVVSFSPHPVMTVCREDASRDWFRSLERCLNWNERKKQKPFPANQL